MKSLIPTLLLLLCVVSFATAQNNKVFSTTRVVWYGIDLSKAKLIDGAAFPYPAEVKTKYADSWNSLILNEADKYDIKKYFSKSSVDYDLKHVNTVNDAINEEELVTYESYSFDKETVQEMLGAYETKAEKGIGLVFIVESLSKTDEAAMIHLTFFDIASKEILFHKRMTGKPRGFGLRNYWAGSYFNIFDQSRKKWKSWAKGR